MYENKKPKELFVLNTKDAVRYKWFQRKSPRLRAIEKDKGIKNYEGLDKQQTKRGVVKVFDITEYLKALFGNVGILLQEGDLQEAILSKTYPKEFYEKLLFALYLLTETRQTISGTEIDYIHCPECGFNSIIGFKKSIRDGKNHQEVPKEKSKNNIPKRIKRKKYWLLDRYKKRRLL